MYALSLKRLMFLLLIPVIANGVMAQQDNSGPYDMGDTGIVRYEDVFHPVVSRSGMVSSQNTIATNVGLEILEQGGNAVDAAVAVGFAMAVTLPRAGNLGGGGFMVLHLKKKSLTTTIDYREMAPTGLEARHFLTDTGEKDPESRHSWHAMGVPGTVAGLYKAWEQYGSGEINWEKLVEPAYKLAKDGFTVNYDLSQLLSLKQDWLKENPETAKSYYKNGGGVYQAGDKLIQSDLAWSLRQIAKHGPKAFYHGAIARKIVADMERHGGHIDAQDLARYEAKEKAPVTGTYRGYEVVSMAPPSSGAVAIIEMLNIMENFPLSEWGRSAKTLHVMTEAMKLSFADRGTYMGDPDFYPVPKDWLLSKERAAALAAKIDLNRATPSSTIAGDVFPEESPSTTHYSIVDGEGNAVSNTYTLSASFGTGKVITGTGILMNNQLHTFSVRAGIPGAVGFIASRANKVETFKRPVSSQSPTMLLKDGEPYLVLGSPGGSRIINAVMQVISNVVDHDLNIAEATNERRIHHQWLPDTLELEPGFNADTAQRLRDLGHNVEITRTMGSTQSIMLKGGYILGASDPRRPGALTRGMD